MTGLHKAFFYGWWVAVAAAIGVGLGTPPIFVFSFSIFLKALTKEFHVNRSAIALAFSLHNLASAAVSPFAGRVIDRLGARRVVLPCTALFAVLLLGNGLITVSVLGVYLFNILGALIGIGTGPLPYSAVISTWFDRRRGTALAVMMLGLGISSLAMPSIVQRVMVAFGWRTAYALYGGATLLIALPTVAALLRDSPRDLGLFPDGASGSALYTNPEGGSGLTWNEARRTSTFWLLLSAVVLLGASVHACVIHLAAMLTDKGFTLPNAALASSVAGFGLLTGRVGTGFLLDRHFGPRLAMYFSGGAALGIILLLAMDSGPIIFVGAFLVGLGMGAEVDVIAYLTSRYFGLKAFGQIYGCTFGSFVVAGASGALLMGVGFDKFGSYTIPLAGFGLAILAAILLFSRLGPYRYRMLQRGENDAAHPVPVVTH